MKNLNKKIGAVALAGMVVFGGVAVSGVKSFADVKPPVECGSQEINDEAWGKLEVAARKYDYKIIEFFGSGQNAKKEAKEAALEHKRQSGKKIYGGVRKLNQNNMEKLIYNIWRFDYKYVPVEFNGGVYLLELAY